MPLVKNNKRPEGGFSARYLHDIRRLPNISDFIDYRVRTGYSLGTAQKRRKGNISI